MQTTGTAAFQVPRGPVVTAADFQSPDAASQDAQLPAAEGEDRPFFAYLFAPSRNARPGPDGAFGEVVVARIDKLREGDDDGEGEGEGEAEAGEAEAEAEEHFCGVWWPVGKRADPATADEARADWAAARRVALQRSRAVARALVTHQEESELRKKEIATARLRQSESETGGRAPQTLDDYVTLRVGRASASGRLVRERTGQRNGLRNIEKLRSLLSHLEDAFGIGHAPA